MTDLNLPNNPLTTLRTDIRAHWTKYLPGMTARLAAEGQLDERIEAAARETETAVLSYVEAAHGTSFTPAQAFWQAWELYRGEWAFLPAETSAEDDFDPELEARYADWRALREIQDEYYQMRRDESDVVLPKEQADGDEA